MFYDVLVIEKKIIFSLIFFNFPNANKLNATFQLANAIFSWELPVKA